VALSPQANYIDWATERNLHSLFTMQKKY
jgi:hypothetical protein